MMDPSCGQKRLQDANALESGPIIIVPIFFFAVDISPVVRTSRGVGG